MPVHFRITSQQHEWLFTPAGQRSGRWIITFETPSGVSSQVIIADESYHPNVVAEEVAAQAQVIERVQALTEGEPKQHREPPHLPAPPHHAT